jgi:hypothetical protein
MPARSGRKRSRDLSAGALLALGGGLALYQLSTLGLGPSGERQLQLSLSIPPAAGESASEPDLTSVYLVVGSLAAPAPSLDGTAAEPATTVFTSHQRPTAPAPSGRATRVPAPVNPTPVPGGVRHPLPPDLISARLPDAASDHRHSA